MLEEERGAGARRDHAFEIEERGLSSLEPVVQIDHEGEEALLVLPANERAVVMRLEALAGTVAIRAKTFVRRDGTAREDRLGQSRPSTCVESHRELDVVEDHALVVADVRTHDEAARGRHGSSLGLRRFDAGDELRAFGGTAEVVDRPEQRLRRVEGDHFHKSSFYSYFRQGLAGAIFVGAVSSSSVARADETISFSPYVAWRRPLTPLTFPGQPNLRKNVAGAAIEWLDGPKPERDGWVLRFGGALEHEADCRTSAACAWPAGGGPREVDLVETNTVLPNNHVEYGAFGRFGWFWRAVQLEGGLLVYTASLSGTPPPPREVFILPDAVARFGRRETFIAIGFGSFAGVSILTPATYVQGELAFADRWATTLTFAGHNSPFAARDVAAHQHLRMDLAMRYRVVPAIRVGLGIGLTTTDPDAPRTKLGGELRFMVEWLRPE